MQLEILGNTRYLKHLCYIMYLVQNVVSAWLHEEASPTEKTSNT